MVPHFAHREYREGLAPPVPARTANSGGETHNDLQASLDVLGVAEGSLPYKISYHGALSLRLTCRGWHLDSRVSRGVESPPPTGYCIITRLVRTHPCRGWHLDSPKYEVAGRRGRRPLRGITANTAREGAFLWGRKRQRPSRNYHILPYCKQQRAVTLPLLDSARFFGV